MALSTEAANVAVFVRSAMGQWHNVVRYGRLVDNPGEGAISAEGLRLKAAKSLGYSATSTQSFAHLHRLKRTTPESLWAPGAVLSFEFRNTM